MSSTLWEKFNMFSLKPSVIACLCLATPTPPKYLDSASASAFLTWRIFSGSPLYTLARCILWATNTTYDKQRRRVEFRARTVCLYDQHNYLKVMLLGLYKNIKGCVSDHPNVMDFVGSDIGAASLSNITWRHSLYWRYQHFESFTINSCSTFRNRINMVIFNFPHTRRIHYQHRTCTTKLRRSKYSSS